MFKKQKKYLPAYLLTVCILLSWVMVKFLITPSDASDFSFKAVELSDFIEQEEPPQPEKILIEEPVLRNDLIHIVLFNVDMGNEHVDRMDKGIKDIEVAIASGDYSEAACDAMKVEITRIKNEKDKVLKDINLLATWEKEHYYAAKTWEFLMRRGYGRAATSAIIGNMMIETAGGTLDLKPITYDPTKKYYGLCQWSLKYNPGIKDLTFEQQLDYLDANIEKEFNTFGKCYKKGFTFDDFINMTDPDEAALAFAKVYERCASFSYSKRESAARIAYDYFDLNS